MLRPQCDVSYEDKDDCGYYGITEGDCLMRGCCWKPTDQPNDPPCFYSISEYKYTQFNYGNENGLNAPETV